jgi:hypothetical protein
MKKPSFNKVMATFGLLFIGLISYLVPAVVFMILINKSPLMATQMTLLICWYYFEIRKFADWCGKKYKEII